MSERRKQILYNDAAFLLLFFVSFWRQISIRYYPDDPFRTYILFACYVILIAAWSVSIYIRVTQRSMRIFLLCEAAVMFFGMTVRFFQDTFWYENMKLMRISGLYVASTLLPIFLFGIYAMLGTGQAENYQIPQKWYLLLIPVAAAFFLIVSDEYFHLMFYTIPGEVQPNLEFHPYIGTFLLAGFGIALMVIRVILMYRRNRSVNVKRWTKILIPVFEPAMILLFSLEYFLVSLQIFPSLAGKEVIELYAKLYYIEVLTWEFYIYMGLVPVNTGYWEIFRRATVGMQIIREGGSLVSENAAIVSAEEIEELKRSDYIEKEPGKELHMHELSDGYLLWNKDVSLIRHTIRELKETAATLEQEGELLAEELKTKNEETKLLAQISIYDDLTGEVAGQLQLMEELSQKLIRKENDEKSLRRLYLLGTYVKRRCNLRLIEKETGLINPDDLRMSFENLNAALKTIGIPAGLHWDAAGRYEAEFSLCAFDLFEAALEKEEFAPREVMITALPDSISFYIKRDPDAGTEAFAVTDAKGYPVSVQDTGDGYRLILSEGGDEK